MKKKRYSKQVSSRSEINVHASSPTLRLRFSRPAHPRSQRAFSVVSGQPRRHSKCLLRSQYVDILRVHSTLLKISFSRCRWILCRQKNHLLIRMNQSIVVVVAFRMARWLDATTIRASTNGSITNASD